MPTSLDPTRVEHGASTGHRWHRQTGVPNCAPCRAYVTRQQKRWRLKKQRAADQPLLLDGAETRRQVRALIAIGHSSTEIARRMGCSAPSVQRWVRAKLVTRETAEKVAAIYDELSQIPGPVLSHIGRARARGWEPPPGWDDTGLLVDGTGTRRRLQALAALGWRAEDLKGPVGMRNNERFRKLQTAPMVRRSVAERVVRVYDELSMTVGPSKQTARWARSRGWLPPLAWDDEHLDDPDAVSPIEVEVAHGIAVAENIGRDRRAQTNERKKEYNRRRREEKRATEAQQSPSRPALPSSYTKPCRNGHGPEHRVPQVGRSGSVCRQCVREHDRVRDAARSAARIEARKLAKAAKQESVA